MDGFPRPDRLMKKRDGPPICLPFWSGQLGRRRAFIVARQDIEGFGQCPYCDYRFELDNELEDFLLNPVVKQWVQQNRSVEDSDIPFI